VEEARDVLLAAGDAEGATEAVNELCEITWIAGESDKMAAHLAQARELAEGLPRNRARARVVSNASRFAMLASRDEEAIELAQEAIEMADELGFLEIKAAALNNYGTARANLHDLGGLDVLREAIELADEIEAPFESTRARGNMAAQLWQLGELQSAYDLWFEAAETSHRYGQTGFARWFDGILCPHSYALGDWQGARGRIDAFLAAVEAAGSHYLAGECFTVRARLKLALDDVDGAIRDAERAVELTRRARDPQNLYPTLANAAVVFGETGDTERAAALVEGFVDAVPGGALGYAAVFLHVLAWTVAGSDRADELAGAIGSDASFPWARAALAYLRGDVVAAADVCGAMGAVTEEAHDRLAAAKLLAADGHRAEADEQLYRALAFYRSVGASRYVREGEALLAASA
jgi:tetratricopeptide (TPR) repeat protein